MLERAFLETYGLPLKAVLSNEDLALNSYRRAVSNQIPKATRIAWTLKKDEIQKSVPGITKQKFLFNLSRASYEKKWGKNYQQPSFGEKFLAFLSKFLPKIGPLRVFQFRMPTPQAEKLFEESFNTTLARYRTLLSDEGAGQLALTNENFDTGGITGPGKYRMNDEAHAKLLNELSKQNFSGASMELHAEMQEFYGHPDAPYATKRNRKAWAKVQAQLEQWNKASPPATTRLANDLSGGSPD
ncbi:MAG TPA: hypothetical protein VKH63_04235 [Candidatus Acidoferrum sp.]|nr:hypothetical protein [Candidatus Acidoferrum sp.]